MLSLAEIKTGTTIVVDETPYLVMSAQHSKQARGSGVNKTTLKNLLTNSTISKTFQGNEKVDKADMSMTKAQFLYSEGEDCHFMDETTFEQFSFPKEQLGDAVYFLTEGNDVDIKNFEGTPIAVQLPPKVTLKVEHTEPGVRGDTASGGSKPVTLEGGLVIQTPLFVNIGDTVRVNTETKEYVERVQ